MPSADLADRARELGRRIADAADADQWAITMVGVDGIGPPDFEELVPRPYLEALNDGRPARYRLTLVLRTDERDLGTVRLGTLDPAGFNDLDVARARRAAEDASRDFEEALDRSEGETEQAPRTGAANKQGVVIFDQERRLLAVTPVAQELLGWCPEDVIGASCASVFSCTDETGAPMCSACGLGMVFDRRAVTEPVMMRMATPAGRREPLHVSFWYLPPSGRIQAPRAMAVFRPDATARTDEVVGPQAG
jgi:PAS domain-containing protein